MPNAAADVREPTYPAKKVCPRRRHSSEGERSDGALRHQPEIAAGELERRALGLPCIAKQPAFQRIEAVGGGEKAIAAGFRARRFPPAAKRLR